MPHEPVPYLVGSPPKQSGLLARYLPIIPIGAASEWLKSRLQPGDWVLDPFGGSPQLVVEAAQAGFKVLVTANNPVLQALLELEIAPPSNADLQSALSELASTFKGSERIEPHIKSLYETECAQCGALIQAECFLWEKQAPAPYARIYHCPHCRDSGERPAVAADREKAARFSSSGLQRAQALERIAPPHDPDRAHAEEALAVYPPRAVYTLFTLINKLDGLQISADRRKFLFALLLHACDQANTLWPHPTIRERPRQLTIPPHYRENNVWLALELGTALWSTHPPKTDLSYTIWPAQLDKDSGVVLFEGRLKDLAANQEKIKIRAVIAALPRPNQAFWTLSALWSGWLWGREAAGPYKSVLRRQRYDWAWHTTALAAVFENLHPLLPEDTPILALTGEAEPGLLSAALVAGEFAGLNLDGLALRGESGQAQIHWNKTAPLLPAPHVTAKTELIARQAAISFLVERGQPSIYLTLHAAVLAALAEKHLLLEKSPDSSGQEEVPKPAMHFGRVQTVLKDTFTYRSGFIRFDGSEQSLEVGQWWLKDYEEAQVVSEKIQTPLVDRVEFALVRYLIRSPGCTFSDLETALLMAFPGLLTPEHELIQACLFSYGEEDPPGSGQWRLARQENPAARRQDLVEARARLHQLGERLGLHVSKDPSITHSKTSPAGTDIPLLWQDDSAKTVYRCYAIASAGLGLLLKRMRQPDIPTLIVLPGSRANLVLYKLRIDPRLRAYVEGNWRLIKYRHLRRLSETPNLTLDNLDHHISMDPLSENAPQMRLL